ncbi:hypothetical protein FBU59_005863, partial [Linderina macrospora]
MTTPELVEAVRKFPQSRTSCDESGSMASRKPQQRTQQYKRNGSFSMALMQNRMSAPFSEEEAEQEMGYLFDDQAGASPIATPTVAWQRISQGTGGDDEMVGIRRGSVLATTISAPVTMQLP